MNSNNQSSTPIQTRITSTAFRPRSRCQFRSSLIFAPTSASDRIALREAEKLLSTPHSASRAYWSAEVNRKSERHSCA